MTEALESSGSGIRSAASATRTGGAMMLGCPGWDDTYWGLGVMPLLNYLL